jgi:hypothetical protein
LINIHTLKDFLLLVVDLLSFLNLQSVGHSSRPAKSIISKVI